MSHFDSLDSVCSSRLDTDEKYLHRWTHIVIILSASGEVFFPFCLPESFLEGQVIMSTQLEGKNVKSPQMESSSLNSSQLAQDRTDKTSMRTVWLLPDTFTSASIEPVCPSFWISMFSLFHLVSILSMRSDGDETYPHTLQNGKLSTKVIFDLIPSSSKSDSRD